jgi:hypothetical protein
MGALCVDGSMPLRRWIELAAALDVDGQEFYAGSGGGRDARPRKPLQGQRRDLPRVRAVTFLRGALNHHWP